MKIYKCYNLKITVEKLVLTQTHKEIFMSLSNLRVNSIIIYSFVLGIFLFSYSVSASTITGTVYNKFRSPLVEVDLELLDEFYRQIGRTRTDGSGRYQFTGLNDGNYTVKALPFRFDLLDQSQSVEIKTINIRGGQGNAYIIQDFYLSPRKGGLSDTELGVIFAQEIPKNAEKIYQEAVKDISKNRRDEGILALRESVKIFPEYYLALHLLGKELFIQGKYGEVAPILLKAVEVNPKSPVTLYYLGSSLEKLNYHKAAITALNQAYILAPASMQILYALGKAERSEGKYEDAEKHLLKAKQISKNTIPDIHWELAQLYGINLKKYKEAINELNMYLKAGKFSSEQTEKIKRLITDLQKKETS